MPQPFLKAPEDRTAVLLKLITQLTGTKLNTHNPSVFLPVLRREGSWTPKADPDIKLS